MNQARLYSKNNGMQLNDAMYALKKYFHLIRWKTDGDDDVLDVGCGDGNVTADFLYPLLPENVRKLVGADVSHEMIEFAKAHHSNKKLSYMQLDISTKQLEVDLEEQFDHVFSFYCLHWIQDQRQCAINLHKILKPDGDIFLIFLAKIPLYQVYENLSKRKIWVEYMENVKKYICPFYYSEDPAKEFRNLLTQVGFNVNFCKTIDRCYTFKDVFSWKKSIMAVDPFLGKMSDDLKEDYINDFFNEIKELNCTILNNNNDEETVQDMDQPYLYAKYNELTPKDVTALLKEYFHLIRWKTGVKENILDVGCGDGHVTANILYPLLPENIQRLVGVDVSIEMVEFAKAQHSNEKTSFMQLDIGAKQLEVNLNEEFDHIFSFFCLQFVQDQRQCALNLYNLLKPGGDVFIVLIAEIPYITAYEILSKHKIWAEYMKDVKKYINPYYHWEEPAEELKSYLRQVGFEVDLCKIVDKSCTFKNMFTWKNFTTSINPLVGKMSDDLKAEFINDVLNELKKLNCIVLNNNQETVQIQYKLLMAYARKPSTA